MVVGMNLMPPKVIEKKACLQSKTFYGLSKDPRPKKHPNTWRKEKKKDFMKVEETGVHHKRYNGHCL